MTTKEFIENYEGVKDKDKFLAECIVKQYIPYEEKMTYCENIIEKTTHKNIADKEVYWRNTPVQYMVFSLTLVDLYSDVNIDFKNILKEFNALDEIGGIDALISFIPNTEYAKFKTILNMVSDDNYENLRSISSWLDTKFDAINLLLDGISQVSE